MDAFEILQAISPASSAQAFLDQKAKAEAAEQERIRRQNAPIIANLQAVIGQMQEQNRLLQEESNRQQQEIERARTQEQRALQEAKRAHRQFWITTTVSIIAIVISIVTIFVR